MQQIVSVRALVADKQKTLLLRRATGRSTILGRYELPGGKLQYGEQPEDAISRYITSEMGATIRSAQLFDVLTYIDHDDRDMQYVFIVYLVSLDTTVNHKLRLGQNYDHYQWKAIAAIQQETLTESTKLLLGISQQRITVAREHELIGHDVTSVTDQSHLIVYSDGGSRGNPGPSAAGFIVMNTAEHVVHEGGMYLGITTNNQAEYQGVRLGLEKAREMGARVVEFRVDSMLVVNQMNGVYSIKNRELWPIYERINELAAEFEKVTFTHVKREFNQLADGMVNKILNAHQNG